jgi:hypothetical protein
LPFSPASSVFAQSLTVKPAFFNLLGSALSIPSLSRNAIALIIELRVVKAF